MSRELEPLQCVASRSEIDYIRSWNNVHRELGISGSRPRLRDAKPWEAAVDMKHGQAVLDTAICPIPAINIASTILPIML